MALLTLVTGETAVGLGETLILLMQELFSGVLFGFLESGSMVTIPLARRCRPVPPG
jgi:hypothetical protein